ncbi:hypothetical protein [Micromonospora sp. NPDC005324]|uniref:hypothetical protein n=1 Tax=Micromonospora sp. NPDC005324 TaxID=3157033 RepID=UPI0033A9F889
MSALSLALPAARWRNTVHEHQAVDGQCPICKTGPRCRVWADAFGQLVAHDLWMPPRPSLTNDRPHPAAG